MKTTGARAEQQLNGRESCTLPYCESQRFTATPPHAVALDSLLAELRGSKRADVEPLLHRGFKSLRGTRKPAYNQIFPLPDPSFPDDRITHFSAAEIMETHLREYRRISGTFSKLRNGVTPCFMVLCDSHPANLSAFVVVITVDTAVRLIMETDEVKTVGSFGFNE